MAARALRLDRAVGPAGRAALPVWPVWVLAAATVFVAGFRVGLNVRASNVIDVGYSGVIGADRIAHGQSPYGHFPVEDDRPKCGPADSDGEVRDRIQTNGRCENANPLGDTYGPVSYLAYLPGYAIFGWSGQWDSLPAVHSDVDPLRPARGRSASRSSAGASGASTRGGARVRVGRVAVHAVRVELEHERRDRPGAAHLGLPRADEPRRARRRGRASRAGRSSPRCSLLPLWLGYPEARRRDASLAVLGFALATALVFFVLFLEPSPWHAARVFYDRTVGYQIGRDSPFSLWDWRQYHAKGLPDLHLVQRALQVLLVAGALALAWVPAPSLAACAWPRSRAPLLVGFELVLTHWFYLYLPWFFPFVALALVAPLPGDAKEARG